MDNFECDAKTENHWVRKQCHCSQYAYILGTLLRWVSSVTAPFPLLLPLSFPKKNRTWEYTPFQAWCTSPLLNNLISLLFISVSLIIHTRKTASWESLADSQSLCNRDEPLSTGFLFPSQSSTATILPC